MALDRVFVSEQYNYNMALRAPAAESMNLVSCTLAIPCFISLPCVALLLENGQFGNGKETYALALRPAGEGDDSVMPEQLKAQCGRKILKGYMDVLSKPGVFKARAVCHSPGHEARFGLPMCYGCDFEFHPVRKKYCRFTSHSTLIAPCPDCITVTQECLTPYGGAMEH